MYTCIFHYMRRSMFFLDGLHLHHGHHTFKVFIRFPNRFRVLASYGPVLDDRQLFAIMCTLSEIVLHHKSDLLSTVEHILSNKSCKNFSNLPLMYTFVFKSCSLEWFDRDHQKIKM